MKKRLAGPSAQGSKLDLRRVSRRVSGNEDRGPEATRRNEQRGAAKALLAEPERPNSARPPDHDAKGDPRRGVVTGAPVEPAAGERGVHLRCLGVTAYLRRRQAGIGCVADDVDGVQGGRVL